MRDTSDALKTMRARAREAGPLDHLTIADDELPSRAALAMARLDNKAAWAALTEWLRRQPPIGGDIKNELKHLIWAERRAIRG
jgi:hypothetical protein